jgi:hypothetical protein
MSLYKHNILDRVVQCPDVCWMRMRTCQMSADPCGRPLPLEPPAQPKLWSPITIDLEVRFRRVIPFWNVQVMLYNICYLEKSIKRKKIPRYSAIGREVFQCNHYYGNILRIGDTGLTSFLTHLWAMLDETYTFQRVV